jgi:hypothetical protein
MQLKRLFENQFDSPAISRQELRMFTEDHLKKLAVQNTANQYDAMLTNTQAAYTAYFGDIADADTAVSIRQSRTKSMNNVMEAFKSEVVNRRKLIIFILKEDSPEFLEFFPGGAKEYSDASLENVETLMNRIVTASTTHQAKLGAETAAVFGTLLTQFQAARGAQLLQKGTVNGVSGKAENSRFALQMLLSENVLVIARNNLGKPEMAKLFFEERLLDNPAVPAEKAVAVAAP